MPRKKTSDRIRKWMKNNQEVLLVFLLAVLIYLPIILGNGRLSNPDSIWMGLYQRTDVHTGEISMGRFGTILFDTLRNNRNYPAAGVIFSLCMLAGVHGLILKLFDIQKKLTKVLCGAVIYFSFSINALMTYFYCMDSYSCALLFCVTAAYLLAKKDGIISWIVSILLLAFSLSLYQAYFFCTVTLCLIYMIVILPSQTDGKKYVLHGLKMIAAMLASVIVYLFFVKVIVPELTSVSLADSRGFSSIGSVSLSSLPSLLAECHQAFFCFSFTDQFANNGWMLKGIVNAIVMLVSIGLCLQKCFSSKQGKWQGWTAVIEIILMPIAMFGIVIAAPETDIYGTTGFLMAPASSWFLILALVLADRYSSMKISAVLKGTVSYLGVLSVITTLVFQYCLYLNYQKGYSFASDLLSTIDPTGSYQSVYISGNVLDNEYYTHGRETEFYSIVKGTVAEYAVAWDDPYATQNGWQNFYHTFFQKDYYGLIQYDSNAFSQKNWDAIEEMPCWPDTGSVQTLENTLVIKLSGQN